METRGLLDKFGSKLKVHPVTGVINVENLPLYEEAGGKTGFKIKVLAREGEQHHFWSENLHEAYSKPELTTVTVDKGKVAVEIIKPQGSTGDYAPFWDKLRELQKPQV